MRWAGRFPLTRPFARRKAAQLFDLCAGFVYSQVLLACVRLQLFEQLTEGPLALVPLAARLGLSPRAAATLLDAAVALELIERRDGGCYGLSVLGAAVLANPGLAAMIEHHRVLYGDLAEPERLLRGDDGPPALSRFWTYAEHADPAQLTPQQVAEYSTLMTASQRLIADDILDAYPIQRHRCLLDVGGGEGNFVRAAAARAPDLRVLLFDLPAVSARAQIGIEQDGLATRAQAFGGDFKAAALPAGADVVSLIRVAFDHSDETVLALLRAVHAALPAGGTVLLAEPMADVTGAEAMGAAYFGFYLWAMKGGRPRSAAQLRGLLESAGFQGVSTHRTRMPLQIGLLSARRR